MGIECFFCNRNPSCNDGEQVCHLNPDCRRHRQTAIEQMVVIAAVLMLTAALLLM